MEKKIYIIYIYIIERDIYTVYVHICSMYNIVHIHIFLILLNRYGNWNIEPKYFRTRFVKIP